MFEPTVRCLFHVQSNREELFCLQGAEKVGFSTLNASGDQPTTERRHDNEHVQVDISCSLMIQAHIVLLQSDAPESEFLQRPAK